MEWIFGSDFPPPEKERVWPFYLILTLTFLVCFGLGFMARGFGGCAPQIYYPPLSTNQNTVSYVYTNSIIQIPDERVDWDDLQELLLFIAADDTESNPTIQDFTSIIPEPYTERDRIALCADFSFTMIQNAGAIGKRLFPVVISLSVYDKWFGDAAITSEWPSVNDDDCAHMVCGARVGNEVYLIEPQTDAVVLFGGLGYRSAQ